MQDTNEPIPLPSRRVVAMDAYPLDMIGYLNSDQLFAAVVEVIMAHKDLTPRPEFVKKSNRSFQIALYDEPEGEHFSAQTNAYLNASAQACDQLVTRMMSYRQILIPPVPSMPRSHRLEPNVRAFELEWLRLLLEHGAAEPTGKHSPRDLVFTLYVYVSYFADYTQRERRRQRNAESRTEPRAESAVPKKQQNKWSVEAMLRRAPSLADLIIDRTLPESRSDHPFTLDTKQDPKQ